MICLTGKYVTVAPNRIKELRESQGITLETLADRVGLSTSYVQRLENGGRNLAVKHFSAFAEALKVAPTDLIESIEDGDKELIEAFRRADPAKKAAVALLLGIEAEVVLKRPSSSQRKSSAKPK